MSNVNAAIKMAAKQKKVCLWEVAERLGMHDANFSRKLRHQVSDSERDEILGIISAIAEGRGEGNAEDENY